VLDLLLWSFTIALAPVALDLVFGLIMRIGDLLGNRHSETAERTIQPWPPREPNALQPLGSVPFAHRPPLSPTAGMLAQHYRQTF
jgi:hypothetical protein